LDLATGRVVSLGNVCREHQRLVSARTARHRPRRPALAPWIRASVTIGFLGAYTTFSTLSLESYRLLEGRSYTLAGANLAGSLAAGVLALYGGVVLGRAL
jgi:fluoride ion exporter CrcB/FEX